MRTALAVEPRNRYGDAREFWTELTKALRGEVRAPARGETEPVSVPEPRVAAPPTQSKSQAESATATTSPVTATPDGPSPRRRSRFYWTVAALVLVAAAVPLRGFLATDTALSDAHRLESALSGGDAHQVAALYAEQALVFENTWDRTQIEKWVKDWWRDNPDTSVRFTSCRSAWRFENSELVACDGVLTRHGKPISFTECQMWSDDGLLQLRENAGAGGCTDGSTWSTRCYLYIKQRRYRWAQIGCDEAFRANPASEETRARLLNNAGMLACALGQVPEAAKRFRESLDLRPKDDTDRRTVQAALDALPRCLLP
jgi:tetratricopeptide (TPR) repeat protein